MDLLTAHQILMKDLVKVPGQFRTGNIGVVRGKDVVHIAPPADNVSGLMADLLRWTEGAEVHPLVKSCVFHYEFEIIHPFTDGNGRMGRMWQTLLLYRWKEIFAWLPVETMVWERQQEYYAVLGRSNDEDDCTEFLRFMLQAIWDTLEMYDTNDQEADQASDQVKRLMQVLGAKTLSAVELMELLDLKHRPTFRKNYLHPALEAGLIEMTLPQTPNARDQKYRRTVI
jgi:Fic family protein